MAIVSTRRGDLLCALAVGGLALALFVATLQPDVGGPEDTPKFQFLGYVLGTGHPPGYPLYVLLSHVFVQLPIGTIAYRANLFSAVMAAIACALTFVLARQLGAGRVAASAAATALATGLSFWTNAVFAEVYSLAAVMVVLTVVFLVAWGSRGGVAWLLAAVATFGLGLGNHLTIVGLVPAAVIYVLAHNWRVLTPRVIAAVGLLLLLGVSQYGFIVLRTYQGAPFLESRATSASELVDVILAKRFASQRFAFSGSALVTTQIPAVAAVIRAELGLVGVVLLGIGVGSVIVRRHGPAWLVIGAALGLFAMVLNLSGDTGGFITPLLPLLWALAAVGVATIANALYRLPRVGVPVAVTVTALALLIPAARLQANYSAADRNKDSTEATFMRQIVRQLPPRAGLVTENYSVVSLLEYFLLTEEAGPSRGISGVDYTADAVRSAAKDGRRVFALGEAAMFMATQGLRFERASSVTSPLGLVYELVGESPCVEVTHEWTDISTILQTGSWVTTLTAPGFTTIEADLRGSSFSGAIARELLAAGSVTQVSIPRTENRSEPIEHWSQSVVLSRDGRRRPVFRVALNSPNVSGRARFERIGPLVLCSHVPPALFRSGSSEGTFDATLDAEAYFGPGWSLPDRVGEERIRRGVSGALLYLPLAGATTYRVQLDLEPSADTRLDFQLNGVAVGQCPPTAGASCEVVLPPAHVKDGVNSLSLVRVPPLVQSNAVVAIFKRARIQRLDAYNGPGR